MPSHFKVSIVMCLSSKGHDTIDGFAHHALGCKAEHKDAPNIRAKRFTIKTGRGSTLRAHRECAISERCVV